MLRKTGQVLIALIGWIIVLLLTAFGAAAISFCAPLPEPYRGGVAGAVLIAVLASMVFGRTWKRRLLMAGPVLFATYGWYGSIPPKMNADWTTDVAVLPDAQVEGDRLVVRNIRNFAYRSDADFDVGYYDKTFDLAQLKTVDLFLSYWGSPHIAHTIMSFGFADGSQLPISIETRKEVGEVYSAVKGFFKTFELAYIIADERDVIGVRVNHRGEDVYLYRLKITPDEARTMLLSYIKTVDKLERQPRFYNAFAHNCTTSILPHIRSSRRLDFNWALIANGHIDQWRYEQGVWGFDIPFQEFRRLSNINDKVREAEKAADFSERIRVGLPSIKP